LTRFLATDFGRSTWFWHLFNMFRIVLENLIDVANCSDATSMQATSADTQPKGLYNARESSKSNWAHSTSGLQSSLDGKSLSYHLTYGLTQCKIPRN
jgi:hypothetical protein